MRPTGEQIRLLQEALLEAYDYDGLRQMVRIYLDDDLAHITPVLGASLRDTTYDLVRWYAAQPGGLQRLIHAARGDNPTSPALAAAAAELGAIDFDPLPLPKKEQLRLRQWVALLSSLLLFIAMAGAFAWLERGRPQPMEAGYNVAVAGFTLGEPRGRCRGDARTAEYSDWLYSAVRNEVAGLPAALKYDLRGPDAIGLICGRNAEERAENARRVADRFNASLIIYGVIEPLDGHYAIQPEFFVADQETFFYAEEVIGPDRLGTPVLVDAAAQDAAAFAANQALDARRQALQHIVIGLGYFFVDDYARAEMEFGSAAALPDWPETAGKEIAYLLVAAAGMRQYDIFSSPAPLERVQRALQTANRINPDYARVQLGLGTVALERSTRVAADSVSVDLVKPELLVEARNWFSSSLTAPDQLPLHYVALKANYGLGQTYGLGAEKQVAGFSFAEAASYYAQVLDAVEASDRAYLRRFAAQAHAGLGRLAGAQEEWSTMADEFRRANAIWNDLPAGQSEATVARNWMLIGWAEGKQSHLCPALAAYQTAVTIGENAGVSAAELREWREIIAYLESQKACSGGQSAGTAD